MQFLKRTRHGSSSAQGNAAHALSFLDGGYAVIDVQDWREECSSQLSALFGVEAQSDSVSHIVQALDDSSAQAFKQLLGDIKLGKPGDILLLKTDDGNRLIECKPNVKLDPEGNVALIVLWFRDITSAHFKQARLAGDMEKLKADIKHYSTILNMLSVPVWQRDAELNIRYYNLAYSALVEENGDSGDLESLDIDRRARQLARAAATAKEAKIERRHIVIDGERKLYDLHELPMSQEQQLIGYAQDVTELEEMQEELQRYISAQSDLLLQARVSLACALARQESRGAHFREEFPSRDDAQWLKHSAGWVEGDAVRTGTRDVRLSGDFVHFSPE